MDGEPLGQVVDDLQASWEEGGRQDGGQQQDLRDGPQPGLPQEDLLHPSRSQDTCWRMLN